MKNNIILHSIEDRPEVVNALIAFAHPKTNSLSLTVYLNKLMAMKGLTPSQVYHRAELDRQTYNRLIQFANPKRAAKRTLMQICIGILATESEAEALLATCGYRFEPNVIEDTAVMFCVRCGYHSIYNVMEAIDILKNTHQFSR